MSMRILVIEDDGPLATFVRKGLEAEHYAVDTAGDGEQARNMALESDYDLLILDLNLPKLDGIEVLRAVRAKKACLPVLVLTARSRIEDRVLSLDTGADDCLIKPFSFTELSARVRALLRRGPRTVDTVLQVADLELDRVERKVKRGGKYIELTSKEFALLEYLLRNAGRRVTRSMIIEHVWNLSFDTSTNLPGSQLFSAAGANVFEALSDLATALQGDTGIDTATESVRSAVDQLTASRVFYGSTVSQLDSDQTFLQSEKLQLEQTTNDNIGVDMNVAATNLVNANNARNSALAAAAQTSNLSLLDYLGKS